MKNILKGLLAHRIMRHHQHRRFLHTVGTTALAFGRGRSLLFLGAIALGSEYLRRRKARAQHADFALNRTLPD